MEDTRSKHKPFQSAAHHIGLDCINPQVSHSSPYHVHPYPSPVRLQHAFQPVLHNSPGLSNAYQNKGLAKQNNEYSGLRNYITPTDSPILGRALCLTPKSSPIPGRVSQLSDRIHDSLTLVTDTDALVAKISAMFPTVSETHIKILLKKYYNREAVVISALQVEKHPITTPGPLAMSPSVPRLQKGALGIYSALQLAKGVSGSTQMTPLTISPHGSPSLRPASVGSGYYSSPRSIDTSLPRPHPSPKMKLRYLKSVFPKAEETLILDVLANKDNNVQKASEELLSMGFTKRESVGKSSSKSKDKKEAAPPAAQIQLVKTAEEKAALKVKLTKKYTTIAERVVSIALESVDWNEDRAEQILSVVLQEETKPKVKTSNDNESEPKSNKSQENTDTNSIHLNKSTPVSVAAYAITGKQDEQTNIGAKDELKDKTTDSIINQHKSKGSRRHKSKGDNTKTPVTMSHGAENNFKSQFMIKATGPNSELQKGPKDNLLLADYITWNGPNPEYRTRCLVKPEGPEVHIPKRRSSACGPNVGLHSGSARLAKGSIYQNINKTSLF